MSDRNQLPPSGWNLPPGVSAQDVDDAAGEVNPEMNYSDIDEQERLRKFLFAPTVGEVEG